MEKHTSTRKQILSETNHLRFVECDGWSYVERTKATGVVCIVALTEEDRLLLVEQYRAPVACHVIELPAGLSGDLADQAEEPLVNAALRELLEETGYQAEQMRQVAQLASSAGLTNEVVTLFIADRLKRIAPGGGDASEKITVHEIPLGEVDQWLTAAQDSGKLIDARIYAGLQLLQRHRTGRSEA